MVLERGVGSAQSENAFPRNSPALDVERSGEAGFLEWERESMSPLPATTQESSAGALDALGKMIGAAGIVTLGEAVHGAAEPLIFRNELLEYLVERKGFTAIAIESGIVESRWVHDYVRGGTRGLHDTLERGLSWTFDRLPQNEALVRWIRQYNQDPRHVRKVNFYGLDVPGSPGNPSANRGMGTALTEALRFIDRVDVIEGRELHRTLDPFLPRIGLNPYSRTDGPSYDDLSQLDRDLLTGGINELIQLMERRVKTYSAASSNADYGWAYRAAIGAAQVDRWLRQFPPGWRRAPDSTVYLSAADDVRDRAQAENVEWIVQQERPHGKVLVFAHLAHVSTVPIRGHWVAERMEEPMGIFLRRQFGRELVSIGTLVGSGTVDCAGVACCAGFRQALEPASTDSIEGLAGATGTPRFLLDVRRAPMRVAKWLGEDHQIGRGEDAFDDAVGNAFDVLVYLGAVTPACH
jgi:erythromycin esterase